MRDRRSQNSVFSTARVPQGGALRRPHEPRLVRAAAFGWPRGQAGGSFGRSSFQASVWSAGSAGSGVCAFWSARVPVWTAAAGMQPSRFRTCGPKAAFPSPAIACARRQAGRSGPRRFHPTPADPAAHRPSCAFARSRDAWRRLVSLSLSLPRPFVAPPRSRSIGARPSRRHAEGAHERAYRRSAGKPTYSGQLEPGRSGRTI